jgi:hypothetical protein
MTSSAIHTVSSKEHMLDPKDIFIVAAHEDKRSQQMAAASAKKAKVSTERLVYSIMVKQYSQKSLIRIRAGNTLFTIAAIGGRVGLVQSYNGDTAENFVDNVLEFFHSARKIGFDVLVAITHGPDIVRVLKLAARKLNDPAVKTKFDSAKGAFAVSTGAPRGK